MIEEITKLRDEAKRSQEHHMALANQAAGAVKMAEAILKLTSPASTESHEKSAS